MKTVIIDGIEYVPKEVKIKHFTDIKTLDDVQSLCPFDVPDGLEPDMVAYIKIKAITKSINQDWIPDWNDANQPKYWPYFNLSPSFGFSEPPFTYDHADTSVGSRLCFESEEKCKYAAAQFLSIYEEFLTIKK